VLFYVQYDADYLLDEPAFEYLRDPVSQSHACKELRMKALGFSLLSASAILAVLFPLSTQNCASQETRAGMQIQGRPVASWVADVNIERGFRDSDPALDVLVSAGPTVLTHLAEILQRDLSTTQQARAADVIGVIAYRNPGAPEIPDVVPALASGAEKKDVRVRQVALQALGAVGRPGSNAIPVLCRCTKDEDERVRVCAVEALRRVGIPTPQALEALHGSLSDPNGTAQIFAVEALYEFGKPATNAVPLLIHLTKNTDVGVRCSAIQILGRVGTNHPEAVVALRSALNDESEMFVRPLAREALKKLEAKKE